MTNEVQLALCGVEVATSTPAMPAVVCRDPVVEAERCVGCPYLLNNTARAGLVRLLIAEQPELARAFETRVSRADSTKNSPLD